MGDKCGMPLVTKVIVTKRCQEVLPCSEHGDEEYLEPCTPNNHLCKIASCWTCDEIMYWVDCPSGGWWKHVEHPEDDHDGSAPTPVHSDERYENG